MNQYLYLIIDLACLSIPFLASFYPRHSFFKEWKYFIPANFIVGLIFIIWDAQFTKIGIWGFNENYLTGLYIGNLPLEEVLFFFAIPYACVFTWFAIKYLIKKNPLEKISSYIDLILGITLLFVALFNLEKAYTSITFGLTGVFLLFNYFKGKRQADIYLSYLLILPFFLISNGILTGSGINDEIVWYNMQENLGIRILTIPIEDSIYGFLLFALNIHLYKFLKGKY